MLCGQADSHDDKRTYVFTVDRTIVSSGAGTSNNNDRP